MVGLFLSEIRFDFMPIIFKCVSLTQEEKGALHSSGLKNFKKAVLVSLEWIAGKYRRKVHLSMSLIFNGLLSMETAVTKSIQWFEVAKGLSLDVLQMPSLAAPSSPFLPTFEIFQLKQKNLRRDIL